MTTAKPNSIWTILIFKKPTSTFVMFGHVFQSESGAKEYGAKEYETLLRFTIPNPTRSWRPGATLIRQERRCMEDSQSIIHRIAYKASQVFGSPAGRPEKSILIASSPDHGYDLATYVLRSQCFAEYEPFSFVSEVVGQSLDTNWADARQIIIRECERARAEFEDHGDCAELVESIDCSEPMDVCADECVNACVNACTTSEVEEETKEKEESGLALASGPTFVTTDGTQIWMENGRIHRDENDLPAVIYANGRREWFHQGDRARADDLPAVICEDGAQIWYVDGRMGRLDDKPAKIEADGTQIWMENGVVHRVGGPAIVNHALNYQRWVVRGELHRTDGPALIDGDHMEWYSHGKLHRLYGPAMICADGTTKWYVIGRPVEPQFAY
jgi:hypothetical protein